MSSPQIVMIGAGNVGYHLGQALFKAGFPIKQVYSRTVDHANRLSEKIGAQSCTLISEISPDADLYLLAVPDDQIITVAQQLNGVLSSKALLAHCSGATPGAVLVDFFPNYGVFYPLQSFSVDQVIDFQEIPICVFANRQAAQQQLAEIATKISQQVHLIDDEQRAILHVAAVFVNNFSNYLFHVGQDILEQEAIPFELLKPLIKNTAEKILDKSPKAMQTGPARRGDQATIQRHLKFLEKHLNYQEIYQLLSQGISDNYKIKN